MIRGPQSSAECKETRWYDGRLKTSTAGPIARRGRKPPGTHDQACSDHEPAACGVAPQGSPACDGGLRASRVDLRRRAVRTGRAHSACLLSRRQLHFPGSTGGWPRQPRSRADRQRRHARDSADTGHPGFPVSRAGAWLGHRVAHERHFTENLARASPCGAA
jgi:hypothetical protein